LRLLCWHSDVLHKLIDYDKSVGKDIFKFYKFISVGKSTAEYIQELCEMSNLLIDEENYGRLSEILTTIIGELAEKGDI
jgi:hypothetical protein